MQVKETNVILQRLQVLYKFAWGSQGFQWKFLEIVIAHGLTYFPDPICNFVRANYEIISEGSSLFIYVTFIVMLA